nr:MAG TPA: hypothetical protein [Caudoviricetes sp.]
MSIVCKGSWFSESGQLFYCKKLFFVYKIYLQ